MATIHTARRPDQASGRCRWKTILSAGRASQPQLHEPVIGTIKGLREHGGQMKKHPGMEHDEPYMAHVAPGKSNEITWAFTRLGEFHFGCLVPGHLDAGMVGRIVVGPR